MDHSPHARLEMEANTTSPVCRGSGCSIGHWREQTPVLGLPPSRRPMEGARWPYCGSNACVTYLCCCFPSPCFTASPGAVFNTHLEQLLCLQTVLGTAARSWRRLSPPIPASLYRPLGKSWDLLFIVKDRRDLFRG